MQMKILFVIPWTTYFLEHTEATFANEPERAPEGVVGLATYLKEHGVDVRVADLQIALRKSGKRSVALDTLWHVCCEFRPDIISFSFYTRRLENAIDIFNALTAWYKVERLPRPLLTAGGIHCTLLPDLTMQYMPFDVLVLGEGERPLLSLCQGANPKDIKGFWKPGWPKVAGDVVENFDDMPFPDWSLIDKNFYSQPCHMISRGYLDRVMPISFSRSCRYDCNFCAHSCFFKFRHHSPEYFIRKIEDQAQQCQITHFILQDSSIGNALEAWSEVCHELIRRGSPYRWWANLRVNQCTEDYVHLLKDAGCIKLFFGFESGSQRILDRMNKRITVEQCERAAELCHKVGIPFYASFIVNYFGEEESDLEQTERMILKTRPTTVAINKFAPNPGSRDFYAVLPELQELLQDAHGWTRLGAWKSPKLYGNMSPERFDYWFTRLLKLRKEINSHEDY